MNGFNFFPPVGNKYIDSTRYPTGNSHWIGRSVRNYDGPLGIESSPAIIVILITTEDSSSILTTFQYY